MNHDFYAYYSALSNVELLQIQTDQENYQPEAVAAAMAILQKRTVTEEDQQALKAIQDSAQLKEQQKRGKREAFVTMAQKVAETAAPGQKKTLRQQLILFCAGLSLIFLLHVVKDTRTLYYGITRSHFLEPFVLLTLFDFIITPLMILLLLKRKKAGWTLAAIIYTASFLIAIETLLFSWGRENDLFNNHIPVTTQLFVIVTYGGILYYLNTARFIRIFGVNAKWQLTTIVLSAVIFAFLFIFI